LPLNLALEKVERQLIKAALKKYKTTRAAAKALKINYSTVSRKAKKYNLSLINGEEVQDKSLNKYYLH
jgi:transcriptional regulator with PAS, ATPase and Fis domain